MSLNWPATKIEMWPVEDLKPYVKNARTHPPEQIDQIAASMERFGFTIPMLVSEDGTIIAGHGRLMAAAQLGLSEVPVMVARGWSDEDRRIYTLADNRLAETSEWDPEMLRIEVDDLREQVGAADLAMFGFSDADLAEILPSAIAEVTGGLTDPDDVPEPDEARPVSQLGDVWALGDHRLICGDATDPAVVARLMDGAQASLLFTSPPYAQQRDYGAAKEKVGDWDALMQGVFATAPVTADAQLLVNLGLVHRDGDEGVAEAAGALDQAQGAALVGERDGEAGGRKRKGHGNLRGRCAARRDCRAWRCVVVIGRSLLVGRLSSEIQAFSGG